MEQWNNFQSTAAPGAVPTPPAPTPAAARKTPETESLINSLAEVSSSLRILEDKYSSLRKKMQLTDQTILELQKKSFKEKKLLTEELTETKLKLQELLDDLMSIKGELKDTVKHNDLKVLDRYLDFWEPLQFVTRKEAETAINELKEQNNIQ
ncbi:MAG: hypothetical protein ACP5N3_03310 [Candidatus Nanoarchaeia archaeon]